MPLQIPLLLLSSGQLGQWIRWCLVPVFGQGPLCFHLAFNTGRGGGQAENGRRVSAVLMFAERPGGGEEKRELAKEGRGPCQTQATPKTKMMKRRRLPRPCTDTRFLLTATTDCSPDRRPVARYIGGTEFAVACRAGKGSPGGTFPPMPFLLYSVSV